MSAQSTMINIPWLDPENNAEPFPEVEQALVEPNGLLAIGGNLSPERLIRAYHQGIFPWYSPGQPILWWTPNPRAVLYPAHLKIARSLKKILRKNPYRITMDQAFHPVIMGCAAPRPQADGTWITPRMMRAYLTLHEMGLAHSVEAWYDQQLVGGLYGVALGRVFFGESMFTRMSDASTIALVHLVRQLHCWGYALIDCQVYSPHFARLGAELIPRPEFIRLLNSYTVPEYPPGPWHLEPDLELIHASKSDV